MVVDCFNLCRLSTGSTDTIKMLFCNARSATRSHLLRIQTFIFTNFFWFYVCSILSHSCCSGRFAFVCAGKRKYNFHEHSSLSHSKVPCSILDSFLLLYRLTGLKVYVRRTKRSSILLFAQNKVMRKREYQPKADCFERHFARLTTHTHWMSKHYIATTTT